jgi:hypothetical protein
MGNIMPGIQCDRTKAVRIFRIPGGTPDTQATGTVLAAKKWTLPSRRLDLFVSADTQPSFAIRLSHSAGLTILDLKS